MKPAPVLWHEDNGRRRQPAREWAQPILGEAGNRMIRNTLQINQNNGAGVHNFQYTNGSYRVNDPRPERDTGYGRGYFQDYDNHHYSGQYRGGYTDSRGVQLPLDAQSNRPNLQRWDYEDDHYNTRTRMSDMRIDEGPKYQLQRRSPIVGHWPIQNAEQPPQPPTNWIDRRHMDGYGWQEARPGDGMYLRQQQNRQHLYRAKQWSGSAPGNPPLSGNQH